MIEYIKGDIFQSTVQTLVVPVNTVGVMGAGLAKEFVRRYPEMERVYKHLCSKNEIRIGRLWIYKMESPWILNFPTKKDWRDPSELWYIQAGLTTIMLTYERERIESIAFPKLGCGLGGLDWPDVKELFDEYLELMGIPVEVYI